MVLHYLQDSRAFRVLWLIEELGLDCEVVYHRREPRTLRAPAALRHVHPLGKSPTLEVDGQVLAESALILTYLATHHGPEWLAPRDSAADWAQQYWLQFAEGSLMPQLLLQLVVQKLGVLAWPIRATVAAQLSLHVAYVAEALTDRTWFVGDHITVADVMMSVPIDLAVQRAGLSASSHPALWQWWQRVQARPAYQRAHQRSQQATI
ncbi:MAG: glutathione S-transferase family protein [Neisseriaceae bacterium]|nr:glutathione S-transferase family protein [Neisseriaceae bacterium]